MFPLPFVPFVAFTLQSTFLNEGVEKKGALLSWRRKPGAPFWVRRGKLSEGALKCHTPCYGKPLFPVPKSSAAAFECGQPPPLPRSNQNLAQEDLHHLHFPNSLFLPNCKCSARSDLPKSRQRLLHSTSPPIPCHFPCKKVQKRIPAAVCSRETEGSVFTCHSDQSISRRVFKYLNIIYYICHCTLGAFKRRDSTMCISEKPR